ncbi:MAG: hypothetical protein MK010_03860 [Erythrobacter sp.]|nr:hypothetical protein [Erythrobacter sp.]
MIQCAPPHEDLMRTAGSDDPKDALFAVSLIGRQRQKFRTCPQSGKRTEMPTPRVKHYLIVVRHAGATSARSSAAEKFEQLHPGFEVWSVLVEPIGAS